MTAYKTFSTTADVGLRLSGSDVQDLFMEAVNGFNYLVMGSEFNQNSRATSYPFEYNGDSYENCLVNLLSELIYLCFHTNRITAEMQLISLRPYHLRCNLNLVENPHLPVLEIKSVTYHRMHIVKGKQLFSTDIIFDI